MKKICILVSFVLIVWCASAQGEPWMEGQSCTSIMVGKLASADGSVITSHTCDSRYRTWMCIEPAADHPIGAMHQVFRGTMHNRFRGDTLGVRLVGEIPEVSHTYAYLNTAYPCLNEHQLAMGESTFGGPDTLRNPDGLFMIEELQRIALQRCTTARDAIRLMGSLAEEYGYADGGECLTIADRMEVWQFEIIGCGRTEKGAVWVAKRVPDNAVAVSCNIPRIDQIDRKSKDFLCSDNVEKVARRYGLWDGKGQFCFWRAYNTDYAKGRNFLEREYHILNTLAPSLNLSFDAAELPFSVVPDHKVSATEVMDLLRATYDGLPHDMCTPLQMVNRKGDTIASPLANPWMTHNTIAAINYLKPNTITFHRGVSVAWCSYSFVAQMRSWLPDQIGGVVWLSVDNPAESPRIPVFCGNTRLPAAFDTCGHHAFNEGSALWQFRKANRLATLDWPRCSVLLNDVRREVEDSTFGQLEDLMKRWFRAVRLKPTFQQLPSDLLDSFTQQSYTRAAQRWQRLEATLWERFWAGF